jgi:hypothetical protein
MRWCLTCPQGHPWEVLTENAHLEPAQLTCPVCGASAGTTTVPRAPSTSDAGPRPGWR